jgi:hypothetical protein
MPIEFHRGEFMFWEDAYDNTPSLGIESDRLQECVLEIKRRRLRGVFGTIPYFRESNLDFLSELPWLEAAQFWDIHLKNLSGLYSLRELGYLRLSGWRPPLALENLPKLRALVWEHGNGDSGSGSLCLLEKLYLWRYKPVSRTFEGLELPQRLKVLEINWSNAATLDGLPPLPNLSRLEIHRCRNLTSLGDLDRKCPNLEVLLIGWSGRLRAAEAERVASNLPRLKHLVAENKLIIGEKAAPRMAE